MFVRSFLVVCLFCAVALGDSRVVKGDAARVELKEFVTRPASFQGRRMTITAEVVSIGADAMSLDLFDAGSKALIVVSLEQLSRTQRQAILTGPVTRATVQGRFEMRKGKAILKAEKVSIVAPDVLAKR